MNTKIKKFISFISLLCISLICITGTLQISPKANAATTVYTVENGGIPSGKKFKSYTIYTSAVSRSSQQWKILTANGTWTDKNGFRRAADDSYMVALGSYYTKHKLGSKFYVETSTGKSFYVTVCDEKADRHTDSKHQYTRATNCMIEFYCSSSLLSSVKYSGDCSSYKPLSGSIKKMIKTESPVTITLNQNNGTGGTSSIKERPSVGFFSSNNSAIEKISTPSRTGYTFTGYYTSSSGGTKIIDATGKIVVNNTYFSSKSNKTVYAHWTANSYQIEYNLNGGSFPHSYDSKYSSTSTSIYVRNPKTTKLHYNTLPSKNGVTNHYFIIEHPTKKGYTFMGWKITGMDKGVEHYYWSSEEGNCKTTSTSWSNTSEAGKATYFKGLNATNNAKVKFTAVWKLNTTV